MIRFVIFIGILVLAVSYFGISLRHIVESPTGQDNLSFVWDLISNGWNILVGWISSITNSVQHTFAK